MKTVIAAAALLLGSCGGTDDNNLAGTSGFNPDLDSAVSTGEPGGDITPIAGLWNATTTNGDANDVVYWNFAATGVLNRYDYQQDGGANNSGENCYIVSDPITVTPEGGNDYSINNVAVTAVVSGQALGVTFLEADKNDLDGDGDTNEIPVFSWTRLVSPVMEDLNSCTVATSDPSSQNTTSNTLNSDEPVVDTADPANTTRPDTTGTMESVTTKLDGRWLSECTTRYPQDESIQFEQEYLLVEGRFYERTINYYDDSDCTVPADISFLRVRSTDLQYPDGSVQTALGLASRIAFPLPPTIDFDRRLLTVDEAELFDPALYLYDFYRLGPEGRLRFGTMDTLPADQFEQTLDSPHIYTAR